MAKNVPERIIYEHAIKGIRYEVVYRSLKETDGILFPQEYVVAFGLGSDQAKFRIILKNAVINGESFNENNFT